MKNSSLAFVKNGPIKTVLVYAIVSSIYIFSSDYFLEKLYTNIDDISRIQTYKGIGFIVITSILLYFLIKRNLDTLGRYYQKTIQLKQESDLQINKSKEEYISLFNHSPLPMWIIDIQSKGFLHVNEAACTIYGYSYKEYLSMSLKDIRPQEDIEVMEKTFLSSLESETFSIPDIIRHKKKNGDIILVKIKTSLLVFNEKKVRLASAIDVTAEMEIQGKLLDSNSKLKAASEIAGIGYWTNDLIKNKIFWSDELYQIFEVDTNTFELKIENITAMFHEEDRFDFKPDYFQTFGNNSINEIERRIITGSGKEKWILERQYLVRDDRGIPIKLEGIALDITNRKVHEKELFESNERFKLLSKATVEAIIDWDIKYKKVFWGDGFKTMLGFDTENIGNHLWHSNIHPDDKEKVLNDLNEIIHNSLKITFIADYRFLKANGETAFVQHKGIIIRDSNGVATRIVGAIIDLTESLNKINKIESQNKALKEISWTQSHVVRAPLANILGLIYLLKENSKSELRDEELIKLIGESAEKLDMVIREIVTKTIEIEEM